MSRNRLILKSILPVSLAVLCACESKGSTRQAASDTTIQSAPVQSQTESSAPAQSQTKVATSASAVIIDPNKANANPTDISAAQRALLESFPDYISKIEGNTVYFKDGTTMPYDDGRVKDFNALLDEGDIEDMFFVPYSSSNTPPPYLFDPGRSRSDALFKKIYGTSAAVVQRNLVSVPWFGQTVKFTKVNGAAEALKAVAAEIAKYPELRKYMESSGTFYWRPVRGAKRLSAHSYGIAFDIAVSHSDYWQWTNKTNNELAKVPYKNRFPKKIVEIFEKHGFIWGGAWYHYDTMHFEYRPEILKYAQYKK